MQITQYTTEVNQTFPYLKDKMVIDLVNGLDTAKKLNQANQRSQEFLKRNLSLISGKRVIAQDNINDLLINGLDTCQHYIDEIMAHQQAHAYTISKLHNKLQQTQNQVADVAEFVADLKQQVDMAHQSMHNRLDKIEQHTKASIELENILSHWQASNPYQELSYMGQCYIVLDTLKWGDFGLYITKFASVDERQKMLATLNNKVKIAMQQVLQRDINRDMHKKDWLKIPTQSPKSDAMQEALQYQGDWSWNDPNVYKMAFMATQFLGLDNEQQAQYQNLVLPMIDINRVSQRMLSDVFDMAS